MFEANAVAVWFLNIVVFAIVVAFAHTNVVLVWLTSSRAQFTEADDVDFWKVVMHD